MGKKSQNKSRNNPRDRTTRQNMVRDPVGLWLCGESAKDLLCPPGYVKLSNNAEVRTCAHIIADLVSSMTIMLMENGETGDKRIKNELSKKMDVTPNRYMTRKNFIYKIVSTMILEGEGNAIAYPDMKDGYLDNLYLWKMNKVLFDCSDIEYIVRYNNIPFSPDELLHFVLIPSEDTPFKGEGYARILKDTVVNIAQANATKTGFLSSKWKPSLIIKVNSDAEELQDKTKRDQLLDTYVGNSEAGKPWIIPADEIDVKEIRPLTLNDLAIQEGIELDKKAVASAFGVPAFLVGVGDFNKDEFNNFISTKISSIAQNIQQEFTRKLLLDPKWYFKFNPKSLMQYDINELTDMTSQLVASGSINRNEQRGYFDLAPVEGLDEYVVLENFIPVSKVGDQKKLKQGGSSNE